MCCESGFWLLVIGIWLNQENKTQKAQAFRALSAKSAAEGGCGPQTWKDGLGRWIERRQECLRHKNLIRNRDLEERWFEGSGVNKRDSPRISREIHIDRKQHLGVSLKGSSLEVLAARRPGQK